MNRCKRYVRIPQTIPSPLTKFRNTYSIVARKIGSYRDVLSLSDVHPASDIFSNEIDQGTIRIKVLACGLDFPTMLVMEGKHMMKKTPPFVPGSDVCGRVVATGDDAKEYDVKVGDIVFGVSQSGAMSEYALMLLENVYKVPKGVSPAIAAGFEMNYGTTYHGLVDLANLQEGETLLVLGASGGVGMAAIDIGMLVCFEFDTFISRLKYTYTIRTYR